MFGKLSLIRKENRYISLTIYQDHTFKPDDFNVSSVLCFTGLGISNEWRRKYKNILPLIQGILDNRQYNRQYKIGNGHK